MARTVITSFILNTDTRVRVAGALDKKDEGVCAFVAGGKIYDNSKYDNSWHKFLAGTKFEVAALVDKTDTYCLLAKERITKVITDEEGNEKKKTSVEVNGVFLRRMAYEKLLKFSEPAEAPAPKEPEIEFGTPAAEVEVSAPEPEVDEDEAILNELLAEVEELDEIEDEGPSDDELAALEDELDAA